MTIQRQVKYLPAIVLLAGLASAYSTGASACVSDRVLGNGTSSPTIVITNRCSEAITWSMCINTTGRSFRDYPRGVTAPGGISRYGLWLNPGERFRYRYNYAGGYDASVRQPSC